MRFDLALYAAVRGILATFVRFYWRPKITGVEHLPAEGPFVLAPVHRSNIDSFLVVGLVRRRMRYMGKDTLWKVKTLGRLFTTLGAFPVHRGSADREALRRCIEVLEGGEPLVLFPEGTRRFGPVVEHIYEGAAYVATRAGVPIVPVGIGGSEAAMPKGSKLPRPVRTAIVIGPPLMPAPAEGSRSRRKAVAELTESLQAALQALFDEATAAVRR